MEMVLSNNFVMLNETEMLMVDGGDLAYDIGYAVGVVVGIVYDGMVILRAVYTGSF